MTGDLPEQTEVHVSRVAGHMQAYVIGQHGHHSGLKWMKVSSTEAHLRA